MLNLDRYHDACEIILTRSTSIWKRFTHDTNDDNERKKYFSQALRNLEQSTEILAERWHLIRTITSQNDLSSIQLPIQRQYVRVQLEIISILLELLQIQAHEMFTERSRRRKAHATYLAVEDFVGKDQDKQEENSTEDAETIRWEDMIKILPDQLIASIMSVLEILGNGDKLSKAEILYYLAKVYWILGQNIGTDYPLDWNARIKDILVKINELPVEKAGLKRLESRSSAGVQHTTITNPVETDWITDEFRVELARQKTELNHSMSHLSQAMEFALQSLNLALSIQDKALIHDSSLLLCDTIGQFDPTSSITFLALSQNASASTYTENVLKRVCHVPSDSELGALFTLIHRIKQDDILTNAKNGIVYRTVMERLKTYWPWKYMIIRSQYYDLTKDMPSLLNFLILHYSSNSEVLYGTLFNSKMSSGKGAAMVGASKQPNIKVTGLRLRSIRKEKRSLMIFVHTFEFTMTNRMDGVVHWETNDEEDIQFYRS